MKYLAIVCPLAQEANVVKFFAAVGRNMALVRGASINGEEPASHKLCNAADDPLAAILGARVVPEDADLVGAGISYEDAFSALQSISFLQAGEGESALPNVAALLSSLGLVLIDPPIEV